MRIYKIAFRNPMDTAANTLARKVMDIIIELYSTNQLFANKRSEIVTKDFKYAGFETTIKGFVNIDIHNEYSRMPFHVEAKYESKQPKPPPGIPMGLLLLQDPTIRSIDRQITIDIQFWANFTEKFFHDFYMMAVNSIRHELGHMIQDQEKMMMLYDKDYDEKKLKEKDPIKRFPEVRKYLASRFEQEPFIRGFMLECKKRRLPLLDTLRDLVHNELFTPNKYIEQDVKKHFGIEAEHTEDILVNLYIQRAKKIFPNIQKLT